MTKDNYEQWGRLDSPTGMFLNALYVGKSAISDAEKINVLRRVFLQEDVCVTADNEKDELIGLEWFVLEKCGFPV